MTLLQLAGPGRRVTARGPARRKVTLLSGFLGSGKTTLLRAELARAGAEAPSVILNDFAQTAVDDPLLVSDGNRPLVITGGCACCTRRADLALALAGLLDAEQRGASSRRDEVVIETSGLSDPGPIAFTLANDPVLQHHYALERVCVTVDAMSGLDTIEHHEVALRQLVAADEVLVTKADLVEPHDVDDLVSRLRELNPSAGVTVTALGELVSHLPPATTAGFRPAAPPDERGEREAHVADISTLELVTERALDWQAFSVWLSLLLHSHGPDVLRVKGVLDVRGVGSVAINGVQHAMHRPEHLADDAAGSGTRIVLIVRGIDPDALDRSFRAFVGLD